MAWALGSQGRSPPVWLRSTGGVQATAAQGGLRGPAGNAEEPGRGLSRAARAAHVPTSPAPLFPPDLLFSPFSLLLLPHPWPCFSVCLYFLLSLHSFQFSSVTQLYPTPCDPMDCSTLGLPVHHQLPEFTQTHVH